MREKQQEEMEGEAERAEREGKRDRGALNGQPRQRKIVWRPGEGKNRENKNKDSYIFHESRLLNLSSWAY